MLHFVCFFFFGMIPIYYTTKNLLFEIMIRYEFGAVGFRVRFLNYDSQLRCYNNKSNFLVN